MTQQQPLSKSQNTNRSAIGFLITGLLLSSGTYLLDQDEHNRHRTFVATTGKAIEHSTYSTSNAVNNYKSETTYVYMIEFNVNNKSFRFNDNFQHSYSNFQYSYNVFNVNRDGTVKVIYDPKNPGVGAKALREGWFARPWPLYFYGGIFTLCSSGAIIHKFLKKSSPDLSAG